MNEKQSTTLFECKDEETGLHYNRHRYYSLYVGRFISKDLIGLLGGFNMYAYAPNPVGWIDPNGLTPSQTFDRNLGGVVGDKMQAHHLIPVAVWKTHSKFFTDIGLGSERARDSYSNGILVPDSCTKAQSLRRLYYHCGSHGLYNRKVEIYIAKIENDFKKKRITSGQAIEEIKNLQKDLKLYVGQSSSTPKRLS